MLPNTSNRSSKNNDIFFKDSFVMRESEICEETCLNENEEYNQIGQFYSKFDELENDENCEILYCEKYYKYKALDRLTSSNERIDDPFAKIHICPFHVNTAGKKPFLQYFMRKYPKTQDNLKEETFEFMSFDNNDGIDPVFKAQNILDISFYCFKKMVFSMYVGFLQKEKNYYLFFDCSDYEIEVHNLYRDNEFWLLTMDELINTREVCGNFVVDPAVTQFFHDNSDFIYLQNEINENYEIPVVAYVGTLSSKSNFMSIFGQGQSDSKSIFGPHYYFYDYNDSVKMSSQMCSNFKKDNKPITIMNWLNSDTIPENIAVIRVILFLGKTKIVETSTNDTSKTTLDMLKEDYTRATKNHREIVNSLFIADREGKWTENYDSVFLGDWFNAECEITYKNTYVVKEYDQQLVLSCHFLDSANYSENDVKYIK